MNPSRKQAIAHVIRTESEAVAAARTIASQIEQGASERDRQRSLPFAEVETLSQSGLLGLIIPRAHGGAEVSYPILAEIFKILAKADSNIAQIPQNHYAFLSSIKREGTESQKDFFFKEVLQGALFGNALSERGTKRAVGFKTRLTRRPEGGFTLTGRKYYCTGALFAKWIPVMALDELDRFIIAFVPRQTAGVEVIDDWQGLGQRTTASGSVVLNEVQVLEEHVIEHWRSYAGPQLFGAFGQLMHVAIDVGIASAALEDAARFVRERSRPWFESGLERATDEPYVIKRFGELGVKLSAAEALLERAAASLDEAEKNLTAETAGRASLVIASAKAFATEVAIEITNALFEVSGTAAMDEKYNLDRHWRNARIHTLHDPVAWKYHHVGHWVLNGKLPPSSGFV
jgi:SfnB family sulfur acquisition oxidoreductase